MPPRIKSPARTSRPTSACCRRGLQEAEDLLVARLKEMGHEPVLEPVQFTPIMRRGEGGVREVIPVEQRTPLTSHNIIVEFPGTDPALRHEVLLFGAHYDAVPFSPGADDNASGVAVALELARLLKDRPTKRTIRVVFFALEEVGLVGARVHAMNAAAAARRRPEQNAAGDAPAAQPAPAPPRIVGMVTLEMLGYYSDKPNSQRSPVPPIEGVFEPPTVGDFLAVATTRSHADFATRFHDAMRASEPQKKLFLATFFPDLPLTPRDILRSDHAPFLVLGMPGVMLTDTSNFRNPHYHLPSDTIETLDLDRLTLAARAVVGAAYSLAEPAE
jgi:Zn-dependent M28 family amino/carboxypeptidase